MPLAPLVLIPPSEGKAPGGRGVPWPDVTHSFPALDPRRVEVADALGAAMGGSAASRQKLLGVGPEAADAATASDLAVMTAPTRRAIDRYTGVLYDALDLDTLSATDRRRLGRQVVIFSGLWGLVRPNDRIPDYKLKMGARLGELGRLATWWRPHLSAALNEVADSRVVWNLLPDEHGAAWRERSPRLVVRARFLDEVERDGDRRLVTVSHWNKLLKGALVRHVIAHQTTAPGDLADFTHPAGYVFRPDLSTLADRGSADAVFVRPLPH